MIDEPFFIQEGKMKRTEWEFEFIAVDMHAAARFKVAYHEDRRKFWQGQLEQAEVEQKLNEEQFGTIPQKLSNTYSNMQSHARSRVDDCKMKVIEHTNYVTEFQRWEKLFGRSNAVDTFKLKYADVEYFNVLEALE